MVTLIDEVSTLRNCQIKSVYKVDTTVFIEYYIVLKEHQLHYDDALQVSNTFDIKFKPVLHDVTD